MKGPTRRYRSANRAAGANPDLSAGMSMLARSGAPGTHAQGAHRLRSRNAARKSAISDF